MLKVLTPLVQGRAVGRSEGPGWGWAAYERGQMSKKEVAMWAGRQAEVKQVSSVHGKDSAQSHEPECAKY